ncbi:MAG: 16S rRNA processing protein RimM [Dysgonamonadaceae bacterium]|jgi:16S rRNA processing protein RimM|nr:16S rRNA processing protein RimM [Dysgonamonadaceae bacterium]
MIKREELIKIGRFNKSHGIKGLLLFTFTDDSFDESQCPFLICELDRIFVPFMLEQYRFLSDTTALVGLKGLNSEKQIASLLNKDVYFPKKYVRKSRTRNDMMLWEYYIGYELQDERGIVVGTIIGVDQSTINILFIVENNENELLIPAVESFILTKDEDNLRLQMAIPEGILNLNKT